MENLNTKRTRMHKLKLGDVILFGDNIKPADRWVISKTPEKYIRKVCRITMKNVKDGHVCKVVGRDSDMYSKVVEGKPQKKVAQYIVNSTLAVLTSVLGVSAILYFSAKGMGY